MRSVQSSGDWTENLSFMQLDILWGLPLYIFLVTSKLSDVSFQISPWLVLRLWVQRLPILFQKSTQITQNKQPTIEMPRALDSYEVLLRGLFKADLFGLWDDVSPAQES